MATKRFCDVEGCGKEVTEYPVSGFVRVGVLDFKVSIELACVAEDPDDESEFDLCNDCFWRAVQGLDKRKVPVLTDVVNAKSARDRHAV